MNCGTCGNATGVCECDDSVLIIPTGPAGLPGVQGAQGPQGIQGAQGIQGNPGTNAPISAVKLVFSTSIAAAGVVTIQKLFLDNAGLLSNQYFIDNNGIETANSMAIISDFVWQIWKVSGVNYIDAQLSGDVNAVTVVANGDVQISFVSAGSYRIIILG